MLKNLLINHVLYGLIDLDTPQQAQFTEYRNRQTLTIWDLKYSNFELYM